MQIPFHLLVGIYKNVSACLVKGGHFLRSNGVRQEESTQMSKNLKVIVVFVSVLCA